MILRKRLFAVLAAALFTACSSAPQAAPLDKPVPPVVSAASVASAPSATPPKPVASKPTTPVLEMETQVAQGDILALRLTGYTGTPPTVTTDYPFTPQFFADGTDYRAFLPVHWAATTGVYTLTVAGDNISIRREILVTEKEFPIQRMEMDASTASETALSADANAEWERRVEPLKAVSDPAPAWDGDFILPVVGKVWTDFATIRYTNDDPNPSRHSGVDLDGETGDPVAAANSGRVQFADYLQLTGNTILIEHGFGLKSWYYHMDGLNVKEGDLVEKGDLIGFVGSTGYSTGPHLHFGMSVNNVFVNPWQAVGDAKQN